MKRNKNRMFSPIQISAICEISFRTVARWIRRGHLGGRQAASEKNSFSDAEVISFLESRNLKVPAALRENSGLRALIVEDDQYMANAIERALSKMGFETRRESNGLNASRIIYEYKPDLITLDLGVKDMSGHDILEMLRGFPPPARPIVLIISGEEEASLIRGLKLGSHGFLKKPFRPAQLEELLAALMDRAA